MKRWYVIDAESGEVTSYSQTVVEHTKAELKALIESEGFRVTESPGGWPAGNENRSAEFYTLVAVAN